MNTMKFDRSTILAAMKENRHNHRDEFNEAIKGYEEEAIARLTELCDKMKAGKRPNIMISMPVPQDHTKDYDRVIRMLEMSVEAVIELEEADFQQYVQDDWSWKQQFATTNAMYSKKG